MIDRYPDSRIAVRRLPHDTTYPESAPFSETIRWFEAKRTSEGQFDDTIGVNGVIGLYALGV